MGKDLHYSIIPFFYERMVNHTKVSRVEEIKDADNYLYRITRVGFMPPLVVHLSDAYSYVEMEYLDKPRMLQRGDFILIAKPEGGCGPEDIERAKEDGIGMGKLAKLMGALNAVQIWTYKSSEEREEEKRRRRGTGA